MKYQKLVVVERQLGISPTTVVRKFDLINPGAQNLDDGSDLAADQPRIRYIGRQSDDIEKANGIHNCEFRH